MALLEEFENQGNFLFKLRSYIPIVILFGGLAVFYFYQSDPFANSFAWICFAVSSLGLAIRIFTVAYTPKNTSGRNTGEGQVADTVNQTGMYSIVRHPLYLGNFLMYLGLAMLSQHLWFVICFVCVFYLYYERIMFAEEQFLRKKFGTKYTDWANSVPAFIPLLKTPNSPELSFSWRKILKKEKNGLAAMCVLFYIFYAVSVYQSSSQNYFNSVWFYLAIISTLIYFVLKFLKYNSSLLEEEGR
ncbi:MAG TPA: isoprenylcysteine carboxylmethyltransferase family protein [Saprospiraceae bacterium]|nr:isoprenylcysteine carboxylmethyltransferase family protein [Saprospiraceae bacterium]